jgi:LmbE family N-acetylglucosaminyl deacetylase
MTDDGFVHLLPHYRRHDDQVFFLIEPNPVLTLEPHEVGLFDELARGVSVAQLTALHPNAASFAERLCEAGIAIACPPQPLGGVRPLLIIEPHLDDAVLAVAGQMLLLRGKRRMTVLTVMRRYDTTKYGSSAHPSLDEATVSALRLSEGGLAARFIGFEHEMLDELDFSVRLREGVHPPRWPDPPLFEAAKHFAPTEAEVRTQAARIWDRVRALEPDEIWMPLGVGDNPDHVLISAACLQLLNTEPDFFDDRRVCFYDDLPLPMWAGHAERKLAVYRRTGSLRLINEDVTNVFADKLRAVALFASQWEMAPSPHIRSNIAALMTASAAAAPQRERKVERMYEVTQPPRRPAISEIAFRPLDLVTTMVALSPWIRNRLAAERVVVLSTTSFGLWSVGAEVLTRAFPNAVIEVFVPEAHLWETSKLSSSQIVARRAEVDELRAVAERELARDALVLVVGDRTLLAGLQIAAQRCVFTTAFGDAMVALGELISDGADESALARASAS